MNKVLATFVLALTVTGTALSQQPDQQPGGANQANVPTNQKVIKDPAEYNAYVTALNMTDPAGKGAAMEAFLKQYPNSIVVPEALEQAMSAYQQANNAAKVSEIATKLLAINPNNVKAMAILVAIKRGANPTGPALEEVRAMALKGLKELPNWTIPEGIKPDEFESQKKIMKGVFASACGFGALQAKDFAAARDCYKQSLEVQPDNALDTYQMGYATLESTPMDINGFWYIAKSINLFKAANNDAAVKQINTYGKAKYKKFHGGDDGWDQIVTAAAGQTAPPSDFIASIPPAPTPQEVACKAVKDNDPATLSFEDWEYILQYRDAGPACNKEAADKVWAAIQDKQKQGTAKLKLDVTVVSATKDSIDAAITDPNQTAGKADLQVALEKPLLHPPSPGAKISVIGIMADYTPSPFLFHMKEGALPETKPAVKPKPHAGTGVKRKPAA